MGSRREASHRAVKGRAAEPSTEAEGSAERTGPKGNEREAKKAAENEMGSEAERQSGKRRAGRKPL